MNQKRGYAIDSYQAIEEGGARLRNAAPRHTSGVNTNWRSGGWRETNVSDFSMEIRCEVEKKFSVQIRLKSGFTKTAGLEAGVSE